MRKNLSSPTTTFIVKFILPTLWGGGLGTWVLFQQISDPIYGSPQPLELRWFAFVFLVVGFLFAVYGSKRLKQVSIFDGQLRVSNFLQEIKINFNEISQIRENRGYRGNPITLYFKAPTKFGTKIDFLPIGLHWKVWHDHPTAVYLRKLVDEAN